MTGSTHSYRRPAERFEYDLEIKRSRFLARVHPLETRSQAQAVLETWRAQFPDARHHCWAFSLGLPTAPEAVGMSDDGEPSGTAGRPMLSAIQNKGFGDVMVVVVRYFGGTKLGAGGLIRAYGGAVSQALDGCRYDLVQPRIKRELWCHFAGEQPLRHWLSQHDGAVEGIRYGEQVHMTVSVPIEAERTLEAFCAAHSMRMASNSEPG